LSSLPSRAAKSSNHWLLLDDALSTKELDGFLGESTSGYPTNAFVLRETASEFAAAIGTEVSPSAIADAVEAVVVSAYDDIAYVAAIPLATSRTPPR
jgi:hypothetical protein